MSQIVSTFPPNGSPSLSPETAPVNLPGGLIISPGHYQWNGQYWDCTLETAYRFWAPGIDRAVRITWAGDVARLMKSLSWITAIGVADDALSPTDITNRALFSKPRLMCGKTCEWALLICSSLGVPARIVRALTGSPPTDYYDGHVMLEAKVSGAWKLFDLAGGYSFNVGDGSAKAVLPLPAGALVEMTQKTVSPDHVPSSAFDALSWVENTLSTAPAREAEWRRVLQIPGIDKVVGGNTETWFKLPAGMEDRASWLLGLSTLYRVKTEAEWNAAFYP